MHPPKIQKTVIRVKFPPYMHHPNFVPMHPQETCTPLYFALASPLRRTTRLGDLLRKCEPAGALDSCGCSSRLLFFQSSRCPASAVGGWCGGVRRITAASAATRPRAYPARKHGARQCPSPVRPSTLR
jgi:hypothetical protein